MLMNPRVWWSRIVPKILPGSEPRVSSLYLYSWYSFHANPEPICLPEIPWHRAVTCTTGDQVRIISLGHASLRILRQLRWDGHQIGSQPSGQRKQLAWSIWCLARPLTRASWQMEVTEGLVRMVPWCQNTPDWLFHYLYSRFLSHSSEETWYHGRNGKQSDSSEPSDSRLGRRLSLNIFNMKPFKQMQYHAVDAL